MILYAVHPQTILGRRLPAQCEEYSTTADLATAMADAAAPLAVECSCTHLTLKRTGDAAGVA